MRMSKEEVWPIQNLKLLSPNLRFLHDPTSTASLEAQQATTDPVQVVGLSVILALFCTVSENEDYSKSFTKF
jgi:hypothetical protein